MKAKTSISEPFNKKKLMGNTNNNKKKSDHKDNNNSKKLEEHLGLEPYRAVGGGAGGGGLGFYGSRASGFKVLGFQGGWLMKVCDLRLGI